MQFLDSRGRVNTARWPCMAWRNALLFFAGIGYLSPVNIYAVPVVGQMVGSILQNISRADQGLGGIGHRVTSLLGSVQFPGGVRAGVGCGVGIGYGWGIGVMLKPSASSRIVDTVRSLLPAQALHVSSDPHDSSAPEIAGTTKENRTDVVLREEFETLKHRVEDLEREMTLLRHDSKHTR